MPEYKTVFSIGTNVNGVKDLCVLLLTEYIHL